MGWPEAPDYWAARLVLHRGIALVYLVAFASALREFVPLLGERGLTPVPRFLRGASPWSAPSVFHLHFSDRFFSVVAWAGVGLSAAAVAGAFDALPVWASPLPWLALWALYLSIVSVGQIWYSFGWESLLLEAGFFAAFLGPADMVPPTVGVLAMRWLLFRVELGAGLIKLRGDPCWRRLTCLDYHHETQPLPNPLSWWFHRLPRPLHRVEVAANHVAQLVAPFGLFAPQPVASLSAGVMILTQAYLMASGNFSWLNVLTLVLAASALDDSVLDMLPVSAGDLAPAPGWHEAMLVALAALVVVLSWWPVRNMLSSRQRMNLSFNPFHLLGAYGAFGSVTRERFEVVIEGTSDLEPGPGTEWREYELAAKPGDPMRRPRQVAPYHLRLDWLMWFAAISPSYAEAWFRPLVERILEGDERTLRLLSRNPFPDRPPAYVRARLYRYRFSTWAERRATGAWWVRTPAGTFMAPLALEGRA